MKNYFKMLGNVWPKLSGQKKQEEKASIVGKLIALNQVGRPQWTPRQYDALTAEGYQKNIIVYRAVSLIARGAASVPWRLYKDNEELLEHPLLRLLHQPSPRQGGSAFVEAVLSYLLLAGNSYIEIVSDRNGKPAELYPLRPDRVQVLPGASGVPQAFEYTVNGVKRLLNVDPSTGWSHVLHLKLFHPLNDWYGMSPIEAAACSIDQHNTVASHNLAILQNGGRPSGALMVGRNDRSLYLTDEQRQELRENVREVYQGSDNAGRILVLEGDFEWQEMGLSPKDLDFIEGKSMTAREIAQAYGVPPMLVGVRGDATFSNYREARFHLWEDTILPLLDYFTDELNRWLAPQFETGLRLAHDVDRIPALAQRREDAWSKIANASFLTMNEKRHAVGYVPVANGDQI